MIYGKGQGIPESYIRYQTELMRKCNEGIQEMAGLPEVAEACRERLGGQRLGGPDLYADLVEKLRRLHNECEAFLTKVDSG